VSAVTARDLSVSVGRARLVDGVSFAVERGEWLSLLGPNGAGKTTLLRALVGIVAADGEVELDGRSLSSLGRRDAARLVALVPQTPIIPLAMSVAEYVLLGRTPHLPVLGSEGADDRSAAARALRRLELEPFADRALGSLSGGELQRAVIARALAQGAPILLLDEPTSALSVRETEKVLGIMRELAESGVSCVFVTHNIYHAFRVCDRFVVMAHGQSVKSVAKADTSLNELTDLIMTH
jgi:iron complex transport system ATP-binding protein